MPDAECLRGYFCALPPFLKTVEHTRALTFKISISVRNNKGHYYTSKVRVISQHPALHG